MSKNIKLDKMLDTIIKDNSEQAEVHFHDYFKDKMHVVLYGTVEDSDEGEEAAKTD